MEKRTRKLTPEQRTKKNMRERLYYAEHREIIRSKGAERRKLKPPVYVPKKKVDFSDNPDREKILRLIEAERHSAA